MVAAARSARSTARSRRWIARPRTSIRPTTRLTSLQSRDSPAERSPPPAQRSRRPGAWHPIRGEIAVWAVPLGASPDTLARAWQLLDAGERERAARLLREVDRTRFVIAHARLRELLAGAVGRAPAALVFEPSEHGKPRLLDAGGVEFNLAHDGDLAVVAVASEAVGVDVEVLRELSSVVSLARRVLPEADALELAALRPARASAVFLERWTELEARLKVSGIGLAGLHSAADGVTTRRLEVPCGYVAAVAAAGAAWSVRNEGLWPGACLQ
jgi:4'-phosphopantetheinyl transferase